MLLLSFHVAEHQFAIAAKQIIEVLPLTSFKPISRAPNYITGLLDYRGKPVPIINLCELNSNKDYNRVLSSRIILVNYTAKNRKIYPLGFIAEKVTETFDIPKQDFVALGISSEDTAYLGGVSQHDGKLIQYVEINGLLTEELQLMLFNDSDNSNVANSKTK